MCKSSPWLGPAILLCVCGGLRAQEGNKTGGDAPQPEAARQTAGQKTRRPRSAQGDFGKAASGERAGQPESPSKPPEGADKAGDEPKAGARLENPHGGPELPNDLGAALSLALSRNPQLLVAEAKLREAQAEYDQVSLSVVHDVTLAFRDYSKEQAAFFKLNTPDDVQAHQETVDRARAKLIYLLGIDTRPEVKADEESSTTEVAKGMQQMMQAMRGGMGGDSRMMGGGTAMMGGMGGGTGGAGRMGIMAGGRGMMGGTGGGKGMMSGGMAPMGGATIAPKSPHQHDAPPSGTRNFGLSAEVRAALQETTDLEFSDQPVSDVLEYLGDKHGHRLQFVTKGQFHQESVTANLHGVSVRAALQAIADLTGTSFVFRDYGILVIPDATEAEDYRVSDALMIAPASIGSHRSVEP